MSNGLFSVDGVDVAALMVEHLGPRLLPCVLYKPGALEARPANPTEAPGRGAFTPHPARGMIEDYKEAVIDGNSIKAGDRKALLIAGTIEGEVVPEGGPDGDQLEIEGMRYNVHRVVDRDPAGATFTLQVRRP